MKKYFLSIVFLLLVNIASSQTLTLQEVFFTGSSYLGVRNDTTMAVYTMPQWTPLESKPVAMVSGYPIAAGAKFIGAGSLPLIIEIRAISPDNYNLPAVAVSSSGLITYPVNASLNSLPIHQVNAFNPFVLNWEYSLDNGATWLPAGTSSNKLYVTYQFPIPETSLFYRETHFQLSCESAALDTTELSILDDIWNEFTDRIVIDAVGDTLGYYTGDLFAGIGDLLTDNSGTCDQWAHLMLDLIKIQGFNYLNSNVDIVADIPVPPACNTAVFFSEVFLIKNHVAGTPSGHPLTCPDFPYLNVIDLFEYVYTEFHDTIGVPGQNNPDPIPVFGGHTVVHINGIYYDPSYGLTYTSMQDFKNTSISGFGLSTAATELDLGIDLDQDSQLDSTYIYSATIVTTDLNAGTFIEMPSTYGPLPSAVSELPNSHTAPTFTLHPNPATNWLTVEMNSITNELFDLEIFDVAGRKVYHQSSKLVNQITVDVSNLEQGVYILRIGGSSEKFIKQ